MTEDIEMILDYQNELNLKGELTQNYEK